jgi:hypothetical protein
MMKKYLYAAIVLAVEIVAIVFMFQLTTKSSSNQALATIDYSTTYATISTNYERKTFYVNGTYWLFYCNGSNLYYTSSPDGLTWRTSTFLSNGISASAMSVWYENGDVHYANAGGPGMPVVYRKGRIVGNSIEWNNEQIVAQASASYEHYNAYVTVDSIGQPWVSFMRYDYNLTGDKKWTVEVTRTNSNDNGAWSSPQDISSPSFYPLRPCIIALSEERMFAVWASQIGVNGRMWNGTEWETVETVTNRHPLSDYGYSSASLKNEVHFAFLENATNNVYSYKRTTDGEWQENLMAEQQDPASVPVLSVDAPKNTLYLLWVSGSTLQMRRMENESWQKVATPDLGLISPRCLSAFYEVSDGKIGTALLELISQNGGPHKNEPLYRLGYFTFANLT